MIEATVMRNKNAPMFERRLEDVQIVAGNEHEYILPPYLDKDGDKITVQAYKKYRKPLHEFVIFTGSSLLIKPKLD